MEWTHPLQTSWFDDDSDVKSSVLKIPRMPLNIFYLVPTRYFPVPEVSRKQLLGWAVRCQRLPRLDFTLFLNPTQRTDPGLNFFPQHLVYPYFLKAWVEWWVDLNFDLSCFSAERNMCARFFRQNTPSNHSIAWFSMMLNLEKWAPPCLWCTDLWPDLQPTSVAVLKPRETRFSVAHIFTHRCGRRVQPKVRTAQPAF